MKVSNVKSIPVETALSILQGRYIGVELISKTFGMSAVLPNKYLQDGKTVFIAFFPEAQGQIQSAIYGLQQKLKGMAINLMGGMYIPISSYAGVVDLITREQVRIEKLIQERIIDANPATLRKQYMERVQNAIDAEGIKDKRAVKTIRSIMNAKWPSNFNVSLSLNVFSFPEPSALSSTVAPEIQAAVSNGNDVRVIEAMAAMIGNVYKTMFETAAAVANSAEKNANGVANKTRGMVAKAWDKVTTFQTEVCHDGKLSLGDMDDAISAFKSMFLDDIDDISPLSARYYAAALYKSAENLGVNQLLDPSTIGVSEDILEEVAWTFKDIAAI